MAAPLTDEDVAQAFACVTPGWFLEGLDTKLGTADVVPILKNAATWGVATGIPGFPYSDGENAEWWSLSIDRDLKGFNVEVHHEYRDDRPTEVLRAGKLAWNRLANMATIAALGLRRIARDDLAARSEALAAEHEQVAAELLTLPDGHESVPGIIKKLDGLSDELAEVDRQLEAADDAYTQHERNVQLAMSTTTTETTKTPRGPLTLEKPVKNTLPGSSLVKATRSPQVHVLPADATRTLCNIDTAKWAETTTVEDGKITCPVCGKGLAAAKKAAKEAGKSADEVTADVDALLLGEAADQGAESAAEGA